MPARSFRIVFCFLLLTTIGFTAMAQSARSVLLKGIDSIPMPPSPNGVALFYTVNERPEIIATVGFDVGAKLQGASIIASTFGAGKVLAIGSPMYLREDMLRDKAVTQFLKNALQWMGNTKKSIRVALTKAIDNPALRAFLAGQKAKTYTVDDFSLKKKTDVIILTTDVTDATLLQKLEQFIINGGTLLFISPYPDAFKTRDTTKTYVAKALGVEPLLAKAGIYNPNIFVSRYNDLSTLRTDSIPDYLHINTLLPRLLISEYEDSFTYYINNYFIKPTLDLVFKYNQPSSPVISNIKQYFSIPDTLPVPSPARPWVINTPKLKAAAKLAYTMYARQTGYETKAAGYQIFPGEVPASAKRINQTVTIPVKVGKQGLVEPPSVYNRPHSTGLYIAAGEKVTITLSPELVKQKLKAQIGVHSDELLNIDQITRTGLNLTRTFGLNKETNVVFSPYGGLLLINIADTCKLQTITINVEGAVKAPYFKLGETSEADWNATIRNDPGPWAELATDNIVLTVPSYRIRNLSDPVKLMQFWDEVLNADADLAVVSRKRAYQERIIIDSDVGVPGAYMFCANDRVVAPDDKSCEWMLDEAFIRSYGSWGHFHELGHRHQFSALDYPGTGEVTVNLFTMYVYDKVLHKGIYHHEGMMSKEEVINKIKTHLADNPTYEKWQQDPFLALSMYIQIIEAFGWDAIKGANTIYRNLPKNQYPKTDQDKRDLWFTTISKTTNSNLTRFFEVWKIPVSDAAKQQVKGYRVWFPKELE